MRGLLLLALLPALLTSSALAQTTQDPLTGRTLLVPPTVRPLSPAEAQASGQAVVSRVLDALHASAAKASAEDYFELFTPEAVFIGTDVSERWTLAQFRAYAEPIFSRGRGWTYTLRPGTRHVVLSADGETAWFDEVLDSSSYGTSRGTGVMVSDPETTVWRIAQYHLTFPIPNALAPEFTRRIREHEGRAAATSAR